jgi:hypothetical protein
MGLAGCKEVETHCNSLKFRCLRVGDIAHNFLSEVSGEDSIIRVVSNDDGNYSNDA